MKKIDILFLIPSLGQGGAEKVLVNLVNNLDTSKFNITIQTLFDEGENKRFLKPHIQYRSFLKHQFHGNTYFLKIFSPKFLYRKIIKEKYDIAVSYLEGPAARIISGCNDTDTKLVSWIHVEQHNKKKASKSFRSYNEAMQCYSKFNQTICVSEYVKKDFLSIFPQIKNVSVLYNTNESKLIKKLSQENIDIGVDSHFVNICAIGTLKESKGFDRLIRIVKKLTDNQFKVKLYILGKGPLEKNLKNLSTELGIQENIVFLGYQLNPYKYISKMDMFTCASFAEGFSTAATEALILGIPVYTVDVSGMKEMLGYNNEYGIVVNNDEESLYQGIKQLLENKDLLRHYKQQAMIRGKVFSTSETVKAVENMFLDLMRGDINE